MRGRWLSLGLALWAAACGGGEAAGAPAGGRPAAARGQQATPAPVEEAERVDRAPEGPVPPVIRIGVGPEAALDGAVAAALRQGQLPGGVVVVGRRDGVLFERAYGRRALEPEPLPMEVDTIFDVASLTKAVVTATSLAILVDEGRVALDRPVSAYLEAFAQGGKQAITVEQLLTHTAGLPAANPLSEYDEGPERALERIVTMRPVHPPGQRYLYSDLGFIVLGALVERVSGEPLEEFARGRIFAPLGMAQTGFRPSAELRHRIAPTERTEHREASLIHGEVHDPRAWRLGGVAGNAGLFSTAGDLARFARMMLGGGELEGRRIVSEETLRRFVSPRRVGSTYRGLGWNAERGGAYGHGGFTGTALWIDPGEGLFVLLLSNRVHPDGRGDVHPLVRRLRRVAGDAARDALPAPPAGPRVLSGVDVLRRDGFELLRGAKVGLITHAAARARDGLSTVELLTRAPGVEVVALFAPEHGLEARSEGHVADGRHGGIPVHSLFGRTRRPSAASLEGIDTLVLDLQDVGARFYTYGSTLLSTLEAAAEHGLRFVVLDRPNPLGGARVEGPVLDEAHRLSSFVNYHPLPIRHGLTLGELARLLIAERDLDVRLEVVALEGWARRMRWQDTGLRWVPPSPNLRTPEQVTLYPGVALVEGTNVSVGRGTDAPFERVGAPWMDGAAAAEHLRALGLPGLVVTQERFAPRARPYRGQRCDGVRLRVTDADAFDPVQTGLALAQHLLTRHSDRWNSERLERMVGDRAVVDALRTGTPVRALPALWRDELAAFHTRRTPHLLYE